MGLYGYRKSFLPNFIAPKSELEKLENGIEMLRVMNLGYKIKLLDTNYKSIGVDLKEHTTLTTLGSLYSVSSILLFKPT